MLLMLMCSAPAFPMAAEGATRLGSEFQVNTYTTGFELGPSVTGDANGAFVVVWEGVLQEGDSGYGIFGQRFASDGSRQGGEFHVNTETIGDQVGAAVAFDSTGGFVVVWGQRYAGPGYRTGVFGQRFGGDGARIGAEFRVNASTTEPTGGPSIAADPSGGFVVVWLGSSPTPGLKARRFDQKAVALGEEFRVNAETASYPGASAIAADGAGGFIVAWDDFRQGGIFARRFAPGGIPVGNDFQVSMSDGLKIRPSIAADASGNFVVVWDSVTHVVSGRRIADGVPAGAEFDVSTYMLDGESDVDVAANGVGNFVVTWRNPSWIYGQEIKATGALVGPPFKASADNVYPEYAPSAFINNEGQCVVAWTSQSDGSAAGVFGQRFKLVVPPIQLERRSLHFGVTSKGGVLQETTPPQEVGLSTKAAWVARSDQPFVTVSPSSGIGRATLTVGVIDNPTLPVSGAVEATITVDTNPGSGSTETLTADVQVYAAGTTTAPFGHFDTPIEGTTTLSGVLPVTGWALDDIGVDRLQLWRDPVSGGGYTESAGANGKIYVGDATFISGPRPDVEAFYPRYPLSYRGDWGYALLTNLLPDLVAGTPAGGRGTFTLYAYVYDVEGNLTVLPSRTFSCDNSSSTKPFGTIDTPTQGESVSGVVNNFGWVLTPQPGTIPKDGSTIVLYIDGTPRGTATYSAFRADIATLFPGYNNSAGPIGLFSIDTTLLANGVHTLAWSATDDLGRADGIGSRYFTVLN